MADPIRDIRILKPLPRLAVRKDEDREATRRKRAIYAAVDARDSRRCALCGRRADPYAVDPLFRMHRAHIRDASLCGPLETWNLASLCGARCHLELVHGKAVTMRGNPDKGTLRFTITAGAAAKIFAGRDVPGHVRVTA